MSYPQPSSNSAVLSGFSFFRLNTKLVSPGDIYESEQSAKAIAIGPDCDFTQVQVSYFDDTRTVSGSQNGALSSFMNQAMIGPQRALVGEINARNDSTGVYQPSGRPGRILLAPGNLYNPAFASALVPLDFLYYEPPVLDVIQYFSDVPDVLPARSDKEFDYQFTTCGVVGTNDIGIMIPYYGRKYASISMINQSLAFDVSIGVIGVDYVIGTAADCGRETLIRAPTPLGVGGDARLVIKASSDGMYDALLITVQPGGGNNFSTPIKVRVSDDEV